MITDLEGNPYFGKIDNDIKRSLDWFLSYFNPKDWEKRKKAIEKKIDFVFDGPDDQPLSKMISLSDKVDTIGWYLYLTEKYLTDRAQYEPIQGARVIPIFKRIGADLDLLLQVEGLEKKMRFLVRDGRPAADNILFELLVALLWTKNGWKVKIIPEDKKKGKSPDLFAEKDKTHYYIECKRLSKSSKYSELEREKWLNLISPIREILRAHNALMEITFHIELSDLPDDFLEKKLSLKIPLATQAGILIDNDTWIVKLNFVDVGRVNDHLSRWDVKYPSETFKRLITGEDVDSTGYTIGCYGHFINRGSGTGNGQYIDYVKQVYGVKWGCDAEEAIGMKARDIKRHLIEACEQIPDGENGAIHVGLETHDGAVVEDLRLGKIFETVGSFQTKGKIINWIYCHLLQSYAPPNQNWVFDETVNICEYSENTGKKPLDTHHLVMPNDIETYNGVHWHRPRP